MDSLNEQPEPAVPNEAPMPQSRWTVRPWLAALFGFAATITFMAGTVITDAQNRERASQEETRVLLEVLAARTQERINSYFGMLRLLRQETTNGEVANGDYFRQRASAILDEFAGFQALTAMTPDGIISDIQPLSGNESALGLDITKVNNARPALLHAIETGDLAVTRPLELAQGGAGFVGYLPVYTDGELAGFYSAVFRNQAFIEPLLGDGVRDNYAVEITDGGSEVYSFGDVDTDKGLVRTDISIGQRRWTIAMSQRDTAFAGLTIAQAAGISLIAALVMAIVFRELARGSSAELLSRAEVWRIAHTSNLTGLPNRYSLIKQLEIRCDEDAQQYVLALLDLKQLRLINAIHGQGVTDKVIQWLGARLVQACPEYLVFHLGGGEFALLADDVDSTASGKLAKYLQALVNQHVDVGDIDLDIDGEVGFLHVRKPFDDPMEALTRAGAALVKAKEEGGPQTYDENIREEAQSRAFMESELRFALERNQLELHFQPICMLASEKPETRGFEALLRWNHPDLGPVRPDVFIPIAETSGMIEEFGNWVLRESSAQIARWRSQGLSYRIGVNLSPRQMLDRNLKNDIVDALEEFGAPPELLIVEITESLAIRNLESAVQLLQELRDIGVGIALDDFGTGYSSLSYLNHLPIDILKLDRVLISHIDDATNSQPLEIARGVIALAHAIGLQVVAEGVETQQQVDLLRQNGCDYAQGYLFSKPLPFSDIERFLKAV